VLTHGCARLRPAILSTSALLIFNPEEVRSDEIVHRYLNFSKPIELQLNFSVRKGHRFLGEGLALSRVGAYRAAAQYLVGSVLSTAVQISHSSWDTRGLRPCAVHLQADGPFGHRRPFTKATVREIE
jgi:hypothetical protein